MNEPAVFVDAHTMPDGSRHLGDPSLTDYNGHPQGAARAAGPHTRYHNVYGMLMARSTREGIASVAPERRPFVLARANFIGGQRYAAALERYPWGRFVVGPCSDFLPRSKRGRPPFFSLPIPFVESLQGEARKSVDRYLDLSILR